MKKHTSKQIIKAIKEGPESRRDWLLDVMLKAGRNNSKEQTYQLWRNDNHPIELDSDYVANQKTDYIHQNPVEAGIVAPGQGTSRRLPVQLSERLCRRKGSFGYRVTLTIPPRSS